MDRTYPQKVGGVIQGDPTQKALLAVLKLHELWPKLVGSLVADHAWPSAYNKGQLTITTDSSTWAQELDYQRLEILERITAELGQGVVVKLRFKTGSRPTKKTARSGPAPAKPRPRPRDLDPETEARVRRSVAGISDPQVREAVLKARLAALRYSD